MLRAPVPTARELARRAALPAALWAVTAGVYVAVTGPRLLAPTADNHFVHLADSFLHGQLEVVGGRPHGQNDWACYDEDAHDACAPDAFARPRPSQHWYVSFPPFPALVILPVVAVFGTATRDALFWALLAGLGPALFFVLLRTLRETGRSDRRLRDDVVLTLLFAFGTVYFFSAVQGAVWFAAHVVAVALVVLYLLFSLDARRPFWAGLMLGLAFMTRPTTAGLVVVFAAEALRVSRLPTAADSPQAAGLRAWLAGVDARAAARRLALFAAPVLAVGLVAMAMNAARWDDPFEFGHRWLLIRWRPRIETWGLFSYHYLGRNLAVFLASLPWLTAHSPHLVVSRHGLALWVTTPAVLLVLWPKKLDATRIALYAGAAAVALWNLLYQNSGWIQFGYRFALDYLPVVFVLLALGGRRFGPGFFAAMLFAVALNTFGAITFDRAWQFYDGDDSQERLFQPD